MNYDIISPYRLQSVYAQGALMISTIRSGEKVILLPKTIDYYQEELTTMLETERFSEAIELLDFLLKCRVDDPQTIEEWHNLLDWLRKAFDSSAIADADEPESDDEEITEQDLHKQRFYMKMVEDPGYVKRLLETVLQAGDLEQKMLAIEQLVVADHPKIDETLKQWLEQAALHPLIQYKVLQALRARGASGTLKLNRAGETVQVQIEDTPLDLIHFSASIAEVIDVLKAVCEVEDPSLVYFAEHIWKEFLAYRYGTSLYREMLEMSQTDAREWAAALHVAISASMTGDPVNVDSTDPDALSRYDLTASSLEHVQRRCEHLHTFLHNTFTL